MATSIGRLLGMFEVTATVVAVLLIGAAAWVSAQVGARRERRLIEARHRRAQYALEFETRTGRYAPERPIPQPRTAERPCWERV